MICGLFFKGWGGQVVRVLKFFHYLQGVDSRKHTTVHPTTEPLTSRPKDPLTTFLPPS